MVCKRLKIWSKLLISQSTCCALPINFNFLCFGSYCRAIPYIGLWLPAPCRSPIFLTGRKSFYGLQFISSSSLFSGYLCCLCFFPPLSSNSYIGEVGVWQHIIAIFSIWWSTKSILSSNFVTLFYIDFYPLIPKSIDYRFSFSVSSGISFRKFSSLSSFS